jgi:hypothetical protein
MDTRYPHLERGRATVTANREAKRPANQEANIIADLKAGLPYIQIAFRHQAGLNRICNIAKANSLTRYQRRGAK